MVRGVQRTEIVIGPTRLPASLGSIRCRASRPRRGVERNQDHDDIDRVNENSGAHGVREKRSCGRSESY